MSCPSADGLAGCTASCCHYPVWVGVTCDTVPDDDRGGAMSLIALEEHYAWDPASDGNVVATWLRSNNPVGYERLYDRGPLRLEQMDAAGIDLQILSLFDPGVQDETDVARADRPRPPRERRPGRDRAREPEPVRRLRHIGDAGSRRRGGRIGACGNRIGTCRRTDQRPLSRPLSR